MLPMEITSELLRIETPPGAQVTGILTTGKTPSTISEEEPITGVLSMNMSDLSQVEVPSESTVNTKIDSNRSKVSLDLEDHPDEARSPLVLLTYMAAIYRRPPRSSWPQREGRLIQATIRSATSTTSLNIANSFQTDARSRFEIGSDENEIQPLYNNKYPSDEKYKNDLINGLERSPSES